LAKARLRTGNPGGNQHNVSSGQSFLQSIIGRQISGDFLLILAIALHPELKVRTAIEEIWERSAVTPGVLTTS